MYEQHSEVIILLVKTHFCRKILPTFNRQRSLSEEEKASQ